LPRPPRRSLGFDPPRGIKAARWRAVNCTRHEIERRADKTLGRQFRVTRRGTY
jgi:hypothetical protein